MTFSIESDRMEIQPVSSLVESLDKALRYASAFRG